MKQLLTILSGLMLAVSAFASDTPRTRQFTTQGPDLYADGQQALPGETYLLVYVTPGATFQGVRSDGTLVSPSTNLKIADSVAEIGDHGAHCKTFAIQYNAEDFPAGGTWIIVLLDTRNADGTLGGVTAGYSGTNNVTASTKEGSALAAPSTVSAGTDTEGSGLAAASAAAASLGTTNQPVIAGIQCLSDGVHITLQNSQESDAYQVQSKTSLGSTWPAATAVPAPANRFKAAVTGGPLSAKVDVPADDHVRFFRVIVPSP